MEQYIGEIRVFPYNTVPSGWHACDGTLLPVQQNMALFSLLSNKYGGDGKTTFALPDLRGRVILNQGVSPFGTFQMAQVGGVDTVALTPNNIPTHNHSFIANNVQGTQVLSNADDTLAQMAVFTSTQSTPLYLINGYTPTPKTKVLLNAKSISVAGGSQSHENRQPFMALNVCIAITGYYPPRD